MHYLTLLLSQLAGMVSGIYSTSFPILRTHSLKVLHLVPTFMSNVKVWRRNLKSLQFLRSKKEDVFETSDEDGRDLCKISLNFLLNTTGWRFVFVEGNVIHTLNRDTR